MKRFIAGNWKMNLEKADALSLVEAVKHTMPHVSDDTTVCIAPPFVYLSDIVKAVEGTRIIVSAQNVSNKESGAFTGEISPTMLRDIGVQATIIGHSERRTLFYENDMLINEKVLLALQHDLKVILCIGETLEERESNKLESVLQTQLSSGLQSVDAIQLLNIVIAYEPVWAIGTGKTATNEVANQTHSIVRNILASLYDSSLAASTPILYGGSVNDSNARELLAMSHIDGALIGGASLKKDAFCSIMKG